MAKNEENAFALGNGKKIFVSCTLCGKRLILKMSNGIWHFKYGRGKEDSTYVPVDIRVDGPLKMKCISKVCRDEHPDHWNYFGPATKKLQDN